MRFHQLGERRARLGAERVPRVPQIVKVCRGWQLGKGGHDARDRLRSCLITDLRSTQMAGHTGAALAPYAVNWCHPQFPSG